MASIPHNFSSLPTSVLLLILPLPQPCRPRVALDAQPVPVLLRNLLYRRACRSPYSGCSNMSHTDSAARAASQSWRSSSVLAKWRTFRATAAPAKDG
ncbi:hypothetical protein DAEQUDRAFT_724515 [Daedalea quercina L-15889]|uniref:Secreted protein n=1 Tax=Daedalea quercina L-15889 TaxID=1314783 RepID=A0A165RTS8_9APHY|nr:hypothetical protein DAEQUDRAFT_724515 [Daedalea quercina L-15889]